MAEITRKSVLLECLSIMREEQRICSKGYNCLEPAKGMEEAWEQGRRKIQILQEIIQALDSEPVLRSLANWQKEELPPRQLTIEQGTSEVRVLKMSDEFKALLDEKHPFDAFDHADGTMELRST